MPSPHDTSDSLTLRSRFPFAAAVLLATLLLSAATAQAQEAPDADDPAQEQLVRSGLDERGALSIEIGRTAVLEMTEPVTEVSIGRPEVADINLLSPTRLLVSGRGPGRTQLLLFGDGLFQAVNVTVDVDVAALQDQLHQLFPDVEMTVAESRGRLVLRGTVPNLDTARQIEAVAAPYGDLLNFLEVAGGQQIMLQVVVAEVSRTATTRLGVNFGFTDGVGMGASNVGAINPFGLVQEGGGPLALGVPSPGTGVTLFGKGEAGSTAMAGFLSALRENNLMRILARPNLVAVSGESASFLAGGEFPVPVTQGGIGDSPAITIEYREFGVKLDFIAIALGDGRIRLKATPEVSDLDFTTAVQLGGFLVPGLTQRRVSTTVELADGQSLAIAGLLDNSINANRSAVPILGDLPVLGTLFRSVRYQRRETELVVFVTPRLVAGINPGQVTTLPGERWDHPTEAELFLLGKLGAPAAAREAPGAPPPLFYGPYGFNRAPERQAD